MPHRVSRDVSKISPNLYMGSRPLNPDAVADDFDTIAFCAEEFQPNSNLYAPARVVRARLHDGRLTQPQIEHATRAAVALYNDFMRGKKVLITCNMGMNRSGLVTAMVLMLIGGSATESIRMVREGRKPAHFMEEELHLAGIKKALSNEMFVRFLKSPRWDHMREMLIMASIRRHGV